MKKITKQLRQTTQGTIGLVYAITVLLLTSAASRAQLTISYSTNPAVFAQGTAITPLTATVSGGATGVNGQTLTVAGNGSAGFTNGTGPGNNSFNLPSGAVADGNGNIYIADAGNNVIRKYAISTGAVSTFAGSGTAGSANGTGTAASFNHPTGVAIDASGTLYVADEDNDLIRKITSAGVVSTLAGSAGAAGDVDAGTGTSARFNLPYGVATDGSGNLFVADYNNHKIRKIVISSTAVSTYAGSGTAGSANGTGTAATFRYPTGVATDASGNVYVADQQNNMIRLINTSQVVTTYAGSTTAGSSPGTGTAASFNYPTSVALDAAGNVYVADKNNNQVRVIATNRAARTGRGPRPCLTPL
jgi:hypothetical protein